MTEETERKKFYDNWEKYALAMYAFPQLKQGPYGEDARAASRLHLVGKGIDDLADTLADNPEANLGQILGADASQYQQFFSELTVNEALRHISEGTGYGGSFAPELTRYGGRTIKELAESAKKYMEAAKKHKGAKTGDEAKTTFEEMQLYKEEAEALEKIGGYDMWKIKNYVTPRITKDIIARDNKPKTN